MIIRLITFLSILIGQNPLSYAYDIIGSVGNLSEHISLLQTEDGTKSAIYLNPYFEVKTDFSLDDQIKNLVIMPELGLTLPQSSPDNNTSRWKIFALTSLKYNFEKLYTTLGTGFFITSISGNGGEEVLNNGNSTTSFPIPDKTVYASNIVLSMGIGKKFNNDLDLNLHTFIFNLENSEDRSVTIGLNLGMHFGEL